MAEPIIIVKESSFEIEVKFRQGHPGTLEKVKLEDNHVILRWGENKGKAGDYICRRLEAGEEAEEGMVGEGEPEAEALKRWMVHKP